MRKLLGIVILLLNFVPKSYGQPANLPDSVQMLDAIQVDAYQLNQPLRTLPGGISVLSTDVMNAVDGTNPSNILNTLPGVSMQTGTYITNRIVIRGMGSRTPYNTNRIKAYLNDIPITSADGISTPEEIDWQNFGRIEVVKGPTSAIYGSGLGGTINFFTPQNPKTTASIDTKHGAFRTFSSQLSGNVVVKNGLFWGSASHLQSEGYRENNHYKRTSALATFNTRHELWQLDATLLLLTSDGGIPSSIGKTLYLSNPEAAAANWKAIGGYKNSQKAVGGVSLTNRLSSKLSNRITLFARWNNNYEKRPFNNLDDHAGSLGFRNRLTYQTSKTSVVLGSEWALEQYGWSLDKEGVQLNKNVEFRQQLNVFGLLYYRPFEQLNVSVAGTVNQISYRLVDQFLTNGDQSGKRRFPVVFSPRIGANYTLNPNVAIYASVGHGFSMPSPEETLLPAGEVNPTIQPEQGIQAEIGSRIHVFGNRTYIDVAIYAIELTNLLVTKRISEDLFTGINAGKTRHRGFELQWIDHWMQKRHFPGSLQSTLGLALNHHRFVDFTDDGKNYNGKQLPGIPSQTVQWQIQWLPFQRLTINLHAGYNGKQFLNDANTETLASSYFLNMKTAYQVKISKVNLQLSGGINNLANARYASMVVVNAIGFGSNEPRYFYPGLPLHGYLGLKIRF